MWVDISLGVVFMLLGTMEIVRARHWSIVKPSLFGPAPRRPGVLLSVGIVTFLFGVLRFVTAF